MLVWIPDYSVEAPMLPALTIWLLVPACQPTGGSIPCGRGDCDSAYPQQYLPDSATDTGTPQPGEEICDGQDNDGDGLVDEGLMFTVFADQDGDGYGYGGTTDRLCELVDGWAEVPGDCDDSDATVHPDAPEICDGKDNDCDGLPEGDQCGFYGVLSVESAQTTILGPGYSRFGFQVAVGQADGQEGQDLLVSAHVQAPSYAGGGYMFYWPFSGQMEATDADVSFFGGQSCYGAGRSMDLGDANGDGLSDALFGAPYERTYSCPGGVTYLVLAPFQEQEFLDEADAAFYGAQATDRAGHGSALGDINGDGLEDVVMGAYGDDTLSSDGGAIFAWYSPLSGTYDTEQADASIYATSDSMISGYRIRAGSDLNGDGIGDFMSCSIYDDLGGSNSGSTYVFFGPVTGSLTLPDADAILIGESAYDYLGFGLGNGDVNGDGLDDILAGAYAADSGAGRAYLLLSPPLQGPNDVADAQAIFGGGPTGGWAGYSVNGGDIDNDGYDDVVVGAPYPSSEGSAYLIYGPTTGNQDLDLSDAVFQGTDLNGYLGSSVQIADLDRDGLGDLVTGAEFAGSGYGTAYVFMNEQNQEP